MHPLTVAIDLDSTIYDLCTPWLAWIRKTLGEDTSAGFTRWETHLQFPRSGMNVYRFLDTEGMFYGLDLLPFAQQSIRAVQAAGVRQVFVTACTTRTGAWEKQQAVKRDFPDLAKDVLVTSGAKDLVRADVLVDDGPHNIEAFPGITIKIPYRYNEQARATFTMTDWRQYPGIIAGLIVSPEVRVVNAATGGEKGSKLARFDLIPADALRQLAEHFGRGAEKYEDRNWERGYDWSLSFAALQRHAWQFWGGEDIDAETGSPHLIAVAWHAFALLTFMQSHPELDDRPEAEKRA